MELMQRRLAEAGSELLALQAELLALALTASDARLRATALRIRACQTCMDWLAHDQDPAQSQVVERLLREAAALEGGEQTIRGSSGN